MSQSVSDVLSTTLPPVKRIKVTVKTVIKPKKGGATTREVRGHKHGLSLLGLKQSKSVSLLATGRRALGKEGWDRKPIEAGEKKGVYAVTRYMPGKVASPRSMLGFLSPKKVAGPVSSPISNKSIEVFLNRFEKKSERRSQPGISLPAAN